MAGAESVVSFRVRVVEAVDPGRGGTGSGASFGYADGWDPEEPVGDDGGQDVTRAGTGPVGAVDGEAVGGQPVGGRGGLQRDIADQVDACGRDKEEPRFVPVRSDHQRNFAALSGGDGFEGRLRQNGAVDRWCERKQAQRAADLPYVLVCIMESYVYLSLITGDEPDAARASRVIHALLPAR